MIFILQFIIWLEYFFIHPFFLEFIQQILLNSIIEHIIDQILNYEELRLDFDFVH